VSSFREKVMRGPVVACPGGALRGGALERADFDGLLGLFERFDQAFRIAVAI